MEEANVRRMLSDRGYREPLEPPCHSPLACCVAARNTDSGRDAVAYVVDGKLGVGLARQLLQSVDPQQTSVALVCDGFTPAVAQLVQGHGLVAELHLRSFFAHVLVDHVLVPKHELVEDPQKEVLGPYALSLEQLPKLSIADPVARYYGFKENEVVRIHRRDGQQQPCLSYRRVGS